MVTLTPEEIEKMRAACKLAARTLEYAGQFVKPGVTTNEIDKLVYDFTIENKAIPACLGYHGYPKTICTSVNHVICHGVPDDQPLQEGDIVNIDVTSILDGFHGDTSATFFVGEVSKAAKDLVECAKSAMWKGIEEVRPFATTGDIGFAINKYVTKHGYTAVREIGGHGIGRKFHTDPFVPSYGKRGRGDKLLPWACITVEPMINQSAAATEEVAIPNSSIFYYETADKCLSAQFEHTILITDTGHEVLTLL